MRVKDYIRICSRVKAFKYCNCDKSSGITVDFTTICYAGNAEYAPIITRTRTSKRLNQNIRLTN